MVITDDNNKVTMPETEFQKRINLFIDAMIAHGWDRYRYPRNNTESEGKIPKLNALC